MMPPRPRATSHLGIPLPWPSPRAGARSLPSLQRAKTALVSLSLRLRARATIPFPHRLAVAQLSRAHVEAAHRGTRCVSPWRRRTGTARRRSSSRRPRARLPAHPLEAAARTRGSSDQARRQSQPNTTCQEVHHPRRPLDAQPPRGFVTPQRLMTTPRTRRAPPGVPPLEVTRACRTQCVACSSPLRVWRGASSTRRLHTSRNA
mmetsp:Transcript_12980/g.34643  ORF Transcript_12980/g.34643 Transcript_12980/m.34643 type:complete len:204 (+) Transcript_12980:193-804(+)